MTRSYRPIEIVYLPGDKELYEKHMQRESRWRTVPHDHLAYRHKTRFSYEEAETEEAADNAVLQKLREYIAKLSE